MTIDLHVHSYFSDGTKSPEELVRLASKTGVSALALTDHDTMDGVAQAQAVSAECDVEVIPGVEISVVHEEQVLHILGYYVDPMQDDLARALSTLQIARDERNEKIIKKLQDRSGNRNFQHSFATYLWPLLYKQNQTHRNGTDFCTKDCGRTTGHINH